jgi:hypothetical protein
MTTDAYAVSARRRLDAERSLAAAKRIAATYGSIDRILSDRLASHVEVVETGPAPAWTDGSVIYVNTAMMPRLHKGMGQRDLVAWLGANYHELGHVLYSPRADSTLIEKIRALGMPGLAQTWNLAEDQRQERLMVAQYPTMAAYYLVMAQRLLMAPGCDVTTLWPLLCGRRYLPQDLLDTVRAAYADPSTAQAVADEVGAYQRLADPAERDHEQALYHLSRLHVLLQNADVTLPSTCGQGNRPSGEGDSVPAETDTADASTPADPSDEGEGEGEGDSPSDAPGSDEGDGEGTDATDGEGDGDGEGEGDEGDDGEGDGSGEGEGEGDAEGEGGEGHSHGGDTASEQGGRGQSDTGTAKPRPNIGDAREAIAGAVAEVLSDPDVAQELDRARAQTQPPKGSLPDAKLPYAKAAAPQGVRTVAERLSKTLSKMVDDVAAAKYRRTDSGKLVPRRYEQGLDRDVWFDRFDPGMQDETSLEVVILVDVSGSMDSGVDRHDTSYNRRTRIQSASEACWAIRRGVDAAEGKVHVIGYDQDAYAGPTGKPSRTDMEYFVTIGGTDPADAMKFARGILDGSEATHRMLIVISDGDWNGASMDMFGALVSEGRYLTVVVGVGMTQQYVERFPGQFRVAADSCDPLVPLFEQVVVAAIGRAVGR